MARPPRAEGNRAIGLHRLAGNPALMEARNPGNPATNLEVSGEQVEVVVEDAARVQTSRCPRRRWRWGRR